MSDEEEVDVLIDLEEEVQQFEASPVRLSKEGEKRFLKIQESYRLQDHVEWNRREEKRVVLQNAHILKTNRFNLINSVVHFAGIAAIIAILLSVI